MKKILISLLLSVMLIMQIPCVFAYEYTPYVGDSVISVTPVKVIYEKEVSESSFEEVDDITDATVVTASCNVKTGSEYDGSELKVSLVVVGYKGKFLRSFNSESVTFTSADEGVKKLTTQLDIENKDIDGVKVYLWDSVENAKPVFNKGVPGSDDNTIDGIIVGGEAVEIDPDTKTGAVEVNAGYVEWPDVVVLTNDSSADVKVDLKGAFPLSKPLHTILESNVGVMGESETAVATITVGDEVYTVEVTQAVPQITNVMFRKYKANMATTAEEYYTDKQLKIQYDVQNPVWTDAFPGPDVEDSTLRSQDYYKTINTLENVSWAYSDTLGANSQNAMFFDNIVPELLGAHFFAIPWVSTSNTATIDDCFKFTIERSGRVYMAFAEGSTLLDSSWKRVYTNMFASNDKSYGRMFYEMRINPTATTHTYQVAYGNQIYCKDFYVAPGETLEVSLPAGKNVPKVFFKYMDTEFVTGASYTVGGKKTDATLLYTAQPNYRDDNLLTDKYDLFVAPSSTTVPLFNGTGNVIIATSTFTETDKKEFALVTVPDELVGATTFRTPYTLSGTVKYEFDISQSARVYVFTNAGNETGNTDVDTIKASLGDDWNNTDFEGDVAIGYRVDDNNVYDGITNESSFYRDYIIQPDDGGKVSITLDNITGDTRVIVVVDQLEE
ncbi:MAG: hypothetical protein IKV86_00990 [Clostridia bacterium]|nr:hypothetical protein [Clostridia bacterium]